MIGTLKSNPSAREFGLGSAVLQRMGLGHDSMFGAERGRVALGEMIRWNREQMRLLGRCRVEGDLGALSRVGKDGFRNTTTLVWCERAETATCLA